MSESAGNAPDAPPMPAAESAQDETLRERSEVADSAKATPVYRCVRCHREFLGEPDLEGRVRDALLGRLLSDADGDELPAPTYKGLHRCRSRSGEGPVTIGVGELVGYRPGIWTSRERALDEEVSWWSPEEE